MQQQFATAPPVALIQGLGTIPMPPFSIGPGVVVLPPQPGPIIRVPIMRGVDGTVPQYPVVQSSFLPRSTSSS